MYILSVASKRAFRVWYWVKFLNQCFCVQRLYIIQWLQSEQFENSLCGKLQGIRHTTWRWNYLKRQVLLVQVFLSWSLFCLQNERIQVSDAVCSRTRGNGARANEMS